MQHRERPADRLRLLDQPLALVEVPAEAFDPCELREDLRPARPRLGGELLPKALFGRVEVVEVPV